MKMVHKAAVTENVKWLHLVRRWGIVLLSYIERKGHIRGEKSEGLLAAQNDPDGCGYLRKSAYPTSNCLMANQAMEGYSAPLKNGYLKKISLQMA